MCTHTEGMAVWLRHQLERYHWWMGPVSLYMVTILFPLCCTWGTLCTMMMTYTKLSIYRTYRQFSKLGHWFSKSGCLFTKLGHQFTKTGRQFTKTGRQFTKSRAVNLLAPVKHGIAEYTMKIADCSHTSVASVGFCLVSWRFEARTKRREMYILTTPWWWFAQKCFFKWKQQLIAVSSQINLQNSPYNPP